LDEAVHGELSLAEWFTLAEDERGELVDGHLVEEEAPNYGHEILVILLGSLLRGWFAPRGGFVGGSDTKLAVGPKQGRRPDLTVYFAGTPLPPRSGTTAQPPDIAIEIGSPTPVTAAGTGWRRWRTTLLSECATTGSSTLSSAA
jgi:Uma2 family endonuclease